MKKDTIQTSSVAHPNSSLKAAFTRLKPTAVYDSYWRFAAERQRVFFRRLEGSAPPWTEDSVIQTYKFTNAYRASDRVSQYLIRNVIYREDLPRDKTELVFRILLFKFFNKIETWRMLESQCGPISYRTYTFEQYDKVLSQAIANGRSIYSAAYIMPPSESMGFRRKHQNHLALIKRMIEDDLPGKLGRAKSMSEAFESIRAYPSIGNFLAFQYVIDINYSDVTDFSEMEFVVPGPGAINGIRKCFSSTGGMSDAEVIRLMADLQEVEFKRLRLNFSNLWGRRLQLIDCQNLFCEVDKYARVVHADVKGANERSRIKQKFRLCDTPIDYLFPPKWGINDNILFSKLTSNGTASLFI